MIDKFTISPTSRIELPYSIAPIQSTESGYWAYDIFDQSGKMIRSSSYDWLTSGQAYKAGEAWVLTNHD